MIRIGCLGAARIAPTALVNPAKSRGDVRLTCVAARDRARAGAFADAHGFERVAANYEDVIADPDVDLVYNPLPINLHAEWSIRALEAGKHVLCEKPLAMNLAEAEAMTAAAESSGRRLIEAFHYRYHPMFEAYVNWIDGRRIGTLCEFDAYFTIAIPDRDGEEIRHLPETGGGAFMDLGCYPLSWLLMTRSDDPVSVTASAQLTSRGVDERMEAILKFADGFEARLTASMALDQKRSAGLRVVGEDGTIEFDNPLAPQLGASLKLNSDGRTEEIPEDRVTTFFYQLGAVARALDSGDRLPTEGDAILRQQRWIDATYDAADLAHLRGG